MFQSQSHVNSGFTTWLCDHGQGNLIFANLSLNLQNGNNIRTDFIGLDEIRGRRDILVNGMPTM